jgi:hypothetical protein
VPGKGSFGTRTLFEDPATHNTIAVKAFDHPDVAMEKMAQIVVGQIKRLIRPRYSCPVAIAGSSLATKTSAA